ncbi:MAG: GIY-YIG nuclease family protein [Bacteroidales bacterium]|nr:GIY-YIG nuclease family protein [Bacteroidales bacterium]
MRHKFTLNSAGSQEVIGPEIGLFGGAAPALLAAFKPEYSPPLKNRQLTFIYVSLAAFFVYFFYSDQINDITFDAMGYYVYILYSEILGRYYYGQTNNLKNRIGKHNAGNVHSTKHGKPWRLYAFKEVSDRRESMNLERKLKNTHSVQKMKSFIVRHKFTLNYAGSQEVIGPEK